LVEVEDVSAAHALVGAIELARETGGAPPGVEGAVVGFRSVVVRLDLEVEWPAAVEAWLLDLVSTATSDVGLATGPRPRPVDGRRDVVDIPVTFDGPDLEAVAAFIGCTAGSVIERVVGTELLVAFVGFAPGFPYLVGLPPELAAVPRRPTPRTSVPAGSVAVGGGYAGVYPRTTPGGWMLLGRTDLQLFDPDNPPYALLHAGDRVRFSIYQSATGDRPTALASAPPSPGQPAPHPSAAPTWRTRVPLRARSSRYVEVLDPGMLSLIEDGGRRLGADVGIPGSGAADPEAMRSANRLVGNPDDAAAIEITAVGPRLRFAADAYLAVVAPSDVGVEVLVDGRPVGTDTVSPVQRGQVVAVGQVSVGLRAYLAIAGGIETPVVVGSRSSDLLSGLGTGPLVSGDQLDVGVATRPHGLLSSPLDPPPGAAPTVTRVIPGPHRFPSADLDELTTVLWTVGDASNRIGIRLRASGRRHRPGGPDAGAAPVIQSTAMVTGAIQVPPDGDPIILMPDHATVGGYPVIACVISADLAKLGQLRPGDALRFTAVDRRTARREHRIRERILAGRVTGWFPTEAGI
jgi:KipI family sensor histidine kinase inhibitor